MDDALERFKTGDVDAFEALFRRHQGEVYGWIVRIVRNPAVAEELTIDTFWCIYRTRARFDTQRPFGAWARRIATRAAIDYLRSADYLRPSGASCELDGPSPRATAANEERQRELREPIERAFGSLPARLRAAAALALIEELPYQEIASALEISPSAVKMRVARAVRLLRASLERMGIRS